MIRRHFIAYTCASLDRRVEHERGRSHAGSHPSAAFHLRTWARDTTRGGFPSRAARSVPRFGTSGNRFHVLLSGGPAWSRPTLTPSRSTLARSNDRRPRSARHRSVARRLGDGSQLHRRGRGCRTSTGSDRSSGSGGSRCSVTRGARCCRWPMRPRTATASQRSRCSTRAAPTRRSSRGIRTGPHVALTAADNAAAEAAQKAGQPPQRALLPGYFHDHSEGSRLSQPRFRRTLGTLTSPVRSSPTLGAHYDVKAALRDTPIATLAAVRLGRPGPRPRKRSSTRCSRTRPKPSSPMPGIFRGSRIRAVLRRHPRVLGRRAAAQLSA